MNWTVEFAMGRKTGQGLFDDGATMRAFKCLISLSGLAFLLDILKVSFRLRGYRPDFHKRCSQKPREAALWHRTSKNPTREAAGPFHAGAGVKSRCRCH